MTFYTLVNPDIFTDTCSAVCIHSKFDIQISLLKRANEVLLDNSNNMFICSKNTKIIVHIYIYKRTHARLGTRA